MDARCRFGWLIVTIAACVVAAPVFAAGHRTPNFVVEAATPEIAAAVGTAAEKYRHELAIEWLGTPMPNWSQPCPIEVQVSPSLGAGGATSFVFDRGEVFGWQMNIQGPLDRVLDSVLPHEVNHTIFASHFRRPLPRWADEGCCTTVEHTSERAKQQRMLVSFLKTGRGIPFSQMFAMREYPRDILPLYAQGHSLASFLLSQGGKAKFVQFLQAGMDSEQWSATIQQHYGFRNLEQLQTVWLDWVRQGSPALAPTGPATLVAANGERPAPNDRTGDVIYRAQNADAPIAAQVPRSPAPAAPLVPIAANSTSSGWRRAATQVAARQPEPLGSESPSAFGSSAVGNPPASPAWPTQGQPLATLPASTLPSATLPSATSPGPSPTSTTGLPPTAERRVLIEWSAGGAAEPRSPAILDASRGAVWR